ncbi:MAG TPA: uridine kinase [Salinivirgaceae bacterium]|nr:uridine kinase [Salinivirgaceae bacterium]
MLIIGIAGGTGSGKTTVVRKIMSKLPEEQVAVLSQDSYYKDMSHIPLQERQEMNFDHPNAIEWPLLIEHIKLLKEGKTIEQPIYSYLTCTRSQDTILVHPRKVIIVEGILVLTCKELRDLFDIKVFVQADPDDRLIRVISRDIIERGRTVEATIERYQQTVKPMHIEFIEPSKSFADIIVPQGGNNTVAIDILTNIVKLNIG